MENIIRILSFNLRYSRVAEQRIQCVLSIIREALPDVIGVQEATEKWVEILKMMLPDFALIGNSDTADEHGEYTAILVRTDRFDICQWTTRWLTDTPMSPSVVYRSMRPRTYTCANLRDRASNRVFYVVNTHFDPLYEETRMVSAAHLCSFVEALSYPVIVMGDFNLDEAISDVYRLITVQYLDDAKYLAKNAYGSETFHKYRFFSATFDYCFVSRSDFQIEEYRVIDKSIDGIRPSDHNPIVVTLQQMK